MKFIYILLALLFPFFFYGQIIIDGDFNDWNEIDKEFVDSSNDGKYGIDFGKLKVDNDSKYLYISFTTKKEINLQSDNDISLFIDIDNNENTGYKINGIGADISYFFGERYGFYYRNGSKKTIKHADIELISLPTVTSSTFEFAIKRKFYAGSSFVNINNNIKVFINQDVNGGDRMPDSGGFDYSMNDSELTLHEFSINKKNSSHLRIMSYNVEKDHFFENEPPYKRLIKAASPDILCFQEVYNHSSSNMYNKIKSYFGGNWYHSKVGQDLIVVSKYPITKTAPIEGNGAFLINKNGKDLLIINTHLYCCDKDSKRQKEVDKIMQFVKKSISKQGSIPLKKDTPIIILGDMNFVGSNRQRKTLIEGDISNESSYGSDFLPDWDSSFMEDARPLTTGFPGSFTWNSDYSSYPKGRLDYMIYTGSVLEKENAYALFTRNIENSILDKFQINSQDTDNASDHFPVIVDFSFKDYNATNDITVNEDYLKLLRYFPNPTKNKLVIEIDSKIQSKSFVLIYDTQGKLVSLKKTTIVSGLNSISLDVAKLSNGVYFAKIITNNLRDNSLNSIKFIIEK